MTAADDVGAWKKALEEIKAWFREQGAESVVENLNGPADETKVDELEKKLGCSLPAAYRWLYSQHDGQTEFDANPFFEDLAFFDIENVADESEGMITGYFNPPKHVNERTPLLESEKTKRWICLASAGGFYLAMNLDSGRIVYAERGTPGLRVVAESLGEFLVTYATVLQDGRYEIAGDPDLDGVTSDEGNEDLERYAFNKFGEFCFADEPCD